MNTSAYEEPEASRKKPCFLHDMVDISRVAALPSQRRKSSKKVELLIEDHDENDNGNGLCKKVDTSITETKAVKVCELSSAAIAEGIDTRMPSSGLKLEQEEGEKVAILVHHLVREFLCIHCPDIVKVFDQERPMPLLDTAVIKELNQRFLFSHESKPTSTSATLLERFLLTCSNASNPKARVIKDKSESKTKRIETSDPGTRKPKLNVITSNFNQVQKTPLKGQRPRSTSLLHMRECVIGEPGSTPMARAKDLRVLGFEDVEDDGPSLNVSDKTSPQNDVNATEHDNPLSDYALRKKRTAASCPKRVQTGEPGHTPTKQYVFFRETPPSFVTETLDQAVHVLEALNNDPEFLKQALTIDQFIELQSSDVSKYTSGQLVQKLGDEFNICGIVSKVYGSRLCGTAGPGVIIIDTEPFE